tara:strand:+ start:204 stop:455 length:252 start_codon:yes stop_codon:yes gene_type:complete
MDVATVPLMGMLSVSTWQIEVLFSAGVAIFAHNSLKISEEMSLKNHFLPRTCQGQDNQKLPYFEASVNVVRFKDYFWNIFLMI